MKKALSLLVTAAMLVAMFAVMAPAAFAAETKTVGTADELIDVVTKINAGELPADTNITLSADIDLTGKAWKPLKVYNGTFDGNGKTITGAAIDIAISTAANEKLNGAGPERNTYVIAEYANASDGNYGEAGFALLAIKAENATFKNFTLKDGSVKNAFNGNNRNWQSHYGGVVAYMVNGTISNVDLVNLDVVIHENASDNQPFLGFAGIMAGVTFGPTTIENCSVDGDSSVNASNNAKYDVAAYIGRHSTNGALTVKNCTTAATVTACATADRSGFHDAQKNDTSAIGCWAAAIVARFNDNTDEGVYDLILDCTNTGTITGAKTNADNLLVGDLNTRTDISYEAPECQHTGGEATCKDKAVCIECGEEYGEIDSDNHGETKTVGAKEATETEEGYTGDKVCEDCGEKLETGVTIPVDPPATEENPPKTGDLMLAVSALALVAAAGAVVIARKRKIEE
ncbi:MAG: hypothetical protein IJX76_09555 [Clostridia bacterium]|nr:hypothetical protein [Clostridia bacterium]